jgi:hypothetical protein
MQDAPTQITEDGTGSYTPQGDAHGNPMRDEEVDTSESETLTQRYERLKAELAEKRMRQEVESMERELAGEMPTTRMGDTSVLTSGHKRLISTSAEVSESQREFFYRPKSPPIFEGKNLKEVSVFKARWDIQFAAMGKLDDSKRVAIAATGLRGIPLEAWGRKSEPVETFSDFIDWCRDLVKDPANRTMHAYLKLKEAKQRKNQSV